MKETEFISQNESKWARFEQLYANNKSHPGELSDLYFDLTNDLSYSQTFYRRRTVRAYLNQLAQAVFTTVHNTRRPSVGGVFHFWFKRLPVEIHQARANIQLALISFLLYAAIGVLAAHFIPHFVEAILGEGYVVQTMENIKKGNPLGIYDSSSQFDMFVMIASNNLKVAFIMFSAGYVMTLGTHYFLFANGVMIGAFQYLFYSQGLLETSFLGIWMHGAFEISAIVIAAGAGITAGKGWMFPSSYSRFEAFQLATKRAVKIMVSLLPFILLAAFIESYVTHHYDVLPSWSKWVIILGSFGIILFFYFLFPLFASQRFEPISDGIVRPKRVVQAKLNMFKIRTAAELITDAFSLYRLGFSDLGKVMFGIFLPCGLILILAQALIYGGPERLDTNLAWYDHLTSMLGISKESPPQLLIYGCWTLLFSMIFAAVGHAMLKQIGGNEVNSQMEFIIRKTPWFWLGGIGLWVFLLFPLQSLIFTVFFLPCVTYQGALLAMDQREFGMKLNLSANYFFENWKPMFGALLVLGVFLFILLQPIAGIFSFNFTPGEVIMPDLLDYMAQNVQNIASGLGKNPDVYASLARKFVYLLVLMFLIPFLGFLFLLNYYSILEIRELTSLKQALELFGKRNKAREGEVN